jgi:hypothetical protein
MKGNQLILLVLLLVVIGGIGTWLYFNSGNEENRPAAVALPESSVIACQGKNFASAFSKIKQLDWYQSMKTNSSVNAFEKDFRYFDSVINENTIFKRSLGKSPVIVSLHVTSADNYQLLVLHQGNNNLKGFDLERLVKEKDADARVLEHTYENNKVYELISGKKVSLFSYANLDGILAISRNTGLVEESIHAFRINRSNPTAQVKKMSEVINDEKIFINFKRLPDFLNVYTAPEFNEYIKDLSSIGSFGAYTLKTEPGKIRLEGSINTGNSNAYLWNCLLGEKPGKAGLPNIIPAGTAMFVDWTADSFGSYFVKYKKFLKSKNNDDSWEKTKQETESATGIKIDDMVPLFGSEWGYAVMEPSGDSSTVDELLAVKLKDSFSGMKKLFEMGQKNRTGHEKIALPEWRGVKIGGFEGGNTLSLLFGALFKRLQNPVFAKVGDYVVFSENLQLLQNCINVFADKQALSESNSYLPFSGSLMSESNFYCYINPASAANMGIDYVKPSFRSRYGENMPIYRGFEFFGFQLISNGAEFNSVIALSKSTESAGHSELAWTLPLESDLLGKPHIVDNFESGHKEIMVQDKNLTLYLINSSGNISWKRKLDEPLAGDIYAMDLYKNGLSEFLFATTNKLYLIDDNGKDAGSYPLNLAEPSHTGLTLFDLNNDKEYVYLVCCDRGKIYGYNGNGKPLSGWMPMTTDAMFNNPVKSFTLDNKQYLYGVSLKGTIYVWNDKGKPVFKPVALHSGVKEPSFVSLETRTTEAADTVGTLYRISFDGSVRKRNIPKFKLRPFFAVIPKNGKGKPESVLASDKMIAGYGGDSSENWKLITSDKIAFAPQIIDFNNKIYIGYISLSSSKIYLFMPSGVSFSGFPRTGNTAFATGDLNGTGDVDLIIGGPNKSLFHYRLRK